jgi:hypothetical protein
MDEKDAATVLEEAADLLLIHGRCTLDAKDRHGRHCVVGAVMAARGFDVRVGAVTNTSAELLAAGHEGVGYKDPAVRILARHVPPQEFGTTPGATVGCWNDNTEDDFEVIDTLRHVAKSLRNGEVE